MIVCWNQRKISVHNVYIRDDKIPILIFRCTATLLIVPPSWYISVYEEDFYIICELTSVELTLNLLKELVTSWQKTMLKVVEKKKCSENESKHFLSGVLGRKIAPRTKQDICWGVCCMLRLRRKIAPKIKQNQKVHIWQRCLEFFSCLYVYTSKKYVL